MEEVISRGNMMKAYHRVVSNKGAAGVDGMTTGRLKEHLQREWPRIKEELLNGTYQPQPVRKVEIPKPGGGTRMLGIPTVCDRLIQQALSQELGPLFESGFSPHSYGFRPGRSAHQAVAAARRQVAEGRQWKRPYTRAKNLIRRGLTEARAWKSAYNGRGPWRNAGASHMHDAFGTSDFAKLGLFSLQQQFHRLQHST